MALCALGLAWAFAGTKDVAVCAFEMVPLSLVMLVFAARRRRFPFSDLGYVLLTWFFFIQCLGGRYEFANVPFPQAVMDALGLERNPVDRIGHFFQGFVPAILLREWLIRRRSIPRGGTQGDPWDAQMDMTMALCGAITAQLGLGKLHDLSIARAEQAMQQAGNGATAR